MGKLCVLLSQRPARLRSSYILHIQCINCWPCLLPRPAYYDCCFVCFIYTCRLKFEVSSSDSASEIKEDSDSEMENDWAEEQHSFYNSDLELPVGLCQNPDRTGWWTGSNRTGPDEIYGRAQVVERT